MKLSFAHPALLWLLLLLVPLAGLPLLGQKQATPGRRWVGLALRLLIALGLILSLAGVQLVRPVKDLTVVFCLDLSASVPGTEQERAEDFIRQAMAEMPSGSRAAVVAFGEQALVERLASEARDLPPVASVPGSGRTNLAAAIRLALALFPEESQKRLVILSDGLENVGEARAQTSLVKARGVEVAVVPLLAPPAEQEAYLEELQVPSGVRKGQSFDLTAVVQSTVAQEATLRLFGDGRLLDTRQASLQPGSNDVLFTVTAEETGFRRYQVELTPVLDTLTQNNVASGFAVVYGPPRVLVVEGTTGEAAALLPALASTGVEATLIAPGSIPSDLAGLSNYDAVVLVDVPADALPEGTMAVLPVYVRELGRGLVMVGGEQGYGAGGYLRTPLEEALPVDMDVRSKTKEPNVALVLVVDRSGSMGRCHCDNPNLLPGQYQRVETGLPKVDIAKDAIMFAREALGPLDYLGVVDFNENPSWVVPLQQVIDANSLQTAIGGVLADGSTNIHAALLQGEQALIEVNARVKHMILLTDGWSRSGDYAELTQRLADEGITLSVVAAGNGSAEYLQGLAESGGGRYYPAPTVGDVPAIFFKETVQAVGSYIIEEPFYPLPAGNTPILRGLDPAMLPALLGYNGTTPKATAQVPLVSARGDPVLAQWQYGLGRAAAWTSDLKGQWATDWVSWERFNAFVSQLVGWTLPEPADDTMQTELRMDGADVHIAVQATDEQGRPRDLVETTATLIGPQGTSVPVKLEQTAAGRYEGDASVAEAGTYLVQVVQRDAQGQPVAQQTSGLAVPYSPEYKRLGQGEPLLRDLTQATGGEVLADPVAAFAPTSLPASRARPLWPTLLLLAALLFPVDVAVRRLRLTPADWRRMQAWVRARLGRPMGRAAGAPAVLGDLFQARERARRYSGRSGSDAEGAVAPAERPRPEVQPSAAGPVSTPAPRPGTPPGETTATPSPRKAAGEPKDSSEGDTLARLRQARERGRRK